jgi:hypothetical protein
MQEVMENRPSPTSALGSPLEQVFLPSSWMSQKPGARRRAAVFAAEASGGALIGVIAGSLGLWTSGKISFGFAATGILATGTAARAVIRMSRLRRRLIAQNELTVEVSDGTLVESDHSSASIGRSLALSLFAMILILTAVVYRQKAKTAEAAERIASRAATVAVKKAETASHETELAKVQVAQEFAHLVGNLETEPEVAAKSTAGVSKRGFVYLGMCDDGWQTTTFDGLPLCRSEFPQGGVVAIAKKGIKVRSALPRDSHFAEAITRLTPGRKVHFTAFHPMALTQPILPGAHVYWGEIELPSSPEK